MLWARGEADITKIPSDRSKLEPLVWTGSFGHGLDHFEKDRRIHTDPELANLRRTILLSRHEGSWGFTLQTYVIKNKKTQELEVTTFVDYVELNGPAHIGGLHRGSLILSVNGESVETDTHKEICRKIKSSGRTLRLVVLSGNCTKKIELFERYLKLKSMLLQKMGELRLCEQQERDLLKTNSLSRASSVRESIYSSTSSDWDRFSLVLSPAAVDGQRQFFRHSGLLGEAKSCSQLSLDARTVSDSGSQLSFDAVNDSFSDSDSSAFLSPGLTLPRIHSFGTDSTKGLAGDILSPKSSSSSYDSLSGASFTVPLPGLTNNLPSEGFSDSAVTGCSLISPWSGIPDSSTVENCPNNVSLDASLTIVIADLPEEMSCGDVPLAAASICSPCQVIQDMPREDSPNTLPSGSCFTEPTSEISYATPRESYSSNPVLWTDMGHLQKKRFDKGILINEQSEDTKL